jgi:DNA-binding MarR family transcriptional regulator
MSATSPIFDAQLLGQTEKACNAILERLLAGTGLTEPQWVSLTLTIVSGGSVDSSQLTDRVAGALKVSEAEARARISELVALELLQAPADEGAPVKVTDAGRQLYARVRAAVNQLTKRLWGDLPTEDLATAGRVLSTVLARANAEISG